MEVEFLQGVTLNPDIDKSTYASRLNLLKGCSCKREMHTGDLRVHMVMGLTPGRGTREREDRPVRPVRLQLNFPPAASASSINTPWPP